jgi:hypothetical protein
VSTYNGQEYQHALIDLRMASVVAGALGMPINSVTFKSLSAKVEAPKIPVHDSQGQIIAWTIDKMKTNGSITLLRSEYLSIRAQMVQQNQASGVNGAPLGPLQIRMNWTLSYGSSPTNFVTDVWRGVMFNEEGFDSKDDQAALDITIPLFFMAATFNNVSPVIYRPY